MVSKISPLGPRHAVQPNGTLELSNAIFETLRSSTIGNVGTRRSACSRPSSTESATPPPPEPKQTDGARHSADQIARNTGHTSHFKKARAVQPSHWLAPCEDLLPSRTASTKSANARSPAVATNNNTAVRTDNPSVTLSPILLEEGASSSASRSVRLSSTHARTKDVLAAARMRSGGVLACLFRIREPPYTVASVYALRARWPGCCASGAVVLRYYRSTDDRRRTATATSLKGPGTSPTVRSSERGHPRPP